MIRDAVKACKHKEERNQCLTLKLSNMQGADVGEIDLADDIFGVR